MALTSAAQTEVPAQCPVVDILPPARIVQPGEIGRFSFQIDEKGKKFDLQYHWTTSEGQIVSGQGTNEIAVRWPKSGCLTVTVDLKGLPRDCAANVSTSSCWHEPLKAEKIAQITGPPFARNRQLSEKVRQAVKDYPNNQIYVIYRHRASLPERSFAQKDKQVLNFVFQAAPELKGDRDRITLVRVAGDQDSVEIWRIPPGADNPTP